MASVTEDVRAVLLGDGTVSGLIGTRIYPNKLPQNPTYPAIRYNITSGESFVADDGPANLENPVIQIDCFAMTYDAMSDLCDAVRSALNGYQGGAIQGAFQIRKNDHYESDPEVYGRALDFQVWWVES